MTRYEHLNYFVLLRYQSDINSKMIAIPVMTASCLLINIEWI